MLLCLRAHGWTRDLPRMNDVTGTKSGDPFEESFKFVLPGYNVRPLEMSGALGQEQLRKLPTMIEARRKNAECFKKNLGNHPSIRLQEECGQSSWFGFSIVLVANGNGERSRVLKLLQAQDVEVRPIVSGNFLKNKEALSYFEYEVHGDLKEADYIDRNGFFVGNHHYDLTDEIMKLAEILYQGL